MLGKLISEDFRYRVDDWFFAGTVRSRLYSWSLRPYRELLTDTSTDVVIEGYPRSGNTYAYVAFWIANGRETKVGHHSHAARNVRFGVRHSVPTILVIRKPLDAAASWLVYRPGVSASSALRAYIRFHSGVIRVISRVVVAPFETVITDFAAVIAELNSRFDQTFLPYQPSPENEARIRHETEWWDYVESGRATIREHTVSRPPAEREVLKARAVERVLAEQALLERAEALYLRIDALGVRSTRPIDHESSSTSIPAG